MKPLRVEYQNIREIVVTFKIDDSIKSEEDEGKPVKITSSGTVGLAEDGDTFVGKLTKYEGRGTGAVRVKHFEILPYSGTKPVVGQGGLVADGAGGVKSADDGVPVSIIRVDTKKKEVTFLR